MDAPGSPTKSETKMTQRRRLVPLTEVVPLLEMLQSFGININSVDVRSDGVSVSSLPSTQAMIACPTPANLNEEPARSAYDEWKKKN